MKKYKGKSRKTKKISIKKYLIMLLLMAIIVGLYTSNSKIIVNNKQNAKAQSNITTVKGSKLKIGDYVNYDHTIQVDPNTKETTKVPKSKLTYTSVKGDLDRSGNGVGTQMVDVSGYKTRWRVYDTQGDQVLLMPETEPKAGIKAGTALGYLWYEKEAHNIAGLYGHGYGADETKKFNYEVGSRIPSERDTRTETKTGTGARPMLLSDVEEAYGIRTDSRRHYLNERTDKDKYPYGMNMSNDAIYYPTLNKTNARSTEEKIDKYKTGDIGVSKTKKILKELKCESYGVGSLNSLNLVHTKTYNAETGKDIQKEIIHSYSSYLATRRFSIDRYYYDPHYQCIWFSLSG